MESINFMKRMSIIWIIYFRKMKLFLFKLDFMSIDRLNDFFGFFYGFVFLWLGSFWGFWFLIGENLFRLFYIVLCYCFFVKLLKVIVVLML